jgi:hypothetical protein
MWSMETLPARPETLQRLSYFKGLPADLKISSAAMVYPNASTIKTPTATLPA